MKNETKTEQGNLEFLKAAGTNRLNYDYKIIFKNVAKIKAVIPGALLEDKKGVRKTFRSICDKVSDQFKETLPNKMQAGDLKKLFSYFGMNKEHLAKKLDAKVVKAIWV